MIVRWLLLFLLIAMAPLPAAGDGIGGRWIASYVDDEIGLVEGEVFVSEEDGRVTVTYKSRDSGEETVRGRFERSNDRISVTMAHPGPGGTSSGPLGQVIPALVGQSVQLGDDPSRSVVIDEPTEPPPGLTMDLRLSPDGQRLDGNWRLAVDAVTRQTAQGLSRSGVLELLYDGEGGAVVTGTEVWVRPDISIAIALPTEDQFAQTITGPAYPHPYLPKWPDGRPGLDSRTLLILGHDLPRGAEDGAILNSDDPFIEYEIYAYTSDLAAPAPNRFHPWLEDGWRKLEDRLAPGVIDEMRELEAMLVRASLNRGIKPGLKTVSINGTEATWQLRFGDQTGRLFLARELGLGQHGSAQFLYSGESVVAQIMLDFDGTQSEIPIMFGLLGNDGYPRYLNLDDGPALLARQDPDEPRRYITDSVRLTEPEYVETFGSDELVVGVLPEESLLVTLAEAVPYHLRPMVAMGEILHAPQDLREAIGGTLDRRNLVWDDYLRLAARCNDLTADQEPRLLANLDAETFSNAIILAGRELETTLKVGEHAAAVLLRDIFAEMLRSQAASLDQPLSDIALKGYRDSVGPNIFSDNLPLAMIEVSAPDGGKMLFGSTFNSESAEIAALSGDEQSVFLLEATRQARRLYADAVRETLEDVVELEPCDDIAEILAIVGRDDFRPVVDMAQHAAIELVDEQTSGGGPGFVRPSFRTDRQARAYINRVRLVAHTLKLQQDLSSRDSLETFSLAVAVVSVPLGIIGSPSALIGISVLGAADVGVMGIEAVSDHLDVRAETEFAIGASAVIGASRYSHAEARQYDWFVDALMVLGIAALTTATDDLLRAYHGHATPTRQATITRGREIARNLSPDELSSLSKGDAEALLLAIVDARGREAILGREALSSFDQKVLKLSDQVTATAERKIAAQTATTLRTRLGALAELPHVIRLIDSNAGELTRLLDEVPDAEALLVFPHDSIESLQAAASRLANRAPPQGPEFYAQSAPGSGSPKGIWVSGGATKNYSGQLAAEYNVVLEADSTVTVARFMRSIEQSSEHGRMLSLDNAKVERDVGFDNWLADLSFPLTNRGVPLGMYMNHRAMQDLLIDYADPTLKTVKLSSVISVNTCVELHWLQAIFPDRPISELVRYTHSYRYTKNFLEQAGFQIDEVVGEILPNWGYSKIGSFKNYFDGKNLDQYLGRFGLKQSDEIGFGYNIHLRVSPRG